MTHDTARPSWYVRPATASLLAAAAWFALAAARPTTTWHLAPLVIVWAPGWAVDDHRRPAMLTAMGAAVAAVAAFALHLLGWLQGPAVLGPTAINEAGMLVAGAAVLDLGTAFARTAR